jgi:hypothetical protein
MIHMLIFIKFLLLICSYVDYLSFILRFFKLNTLFYKDVSQFYQFNYFEEFILNYIKPKFEQRNFIRFNKKCIKIFPIQLLLKAEFLSYKVGGVVYLQNQYSYFRIPIKGNNI